MMSDERMRVLGIQIVGGGLEKNKVGMVLILCKPASDSFVEILKSFVERS
jgi:hypothetical protein